MNYAKQQQKFENKMKEMKLHVEMDKFIGSLTEQESLIAESGGGAGHLKRIRQLTNIIKDNREKLVNKSGIEIRQEFSSQCSLDNTYTYKSVCEFKGENGDFIPINTSNYLNKQKHLNKFFEDKSLVQNLIYREMGQTNTWKSNISTKQRSFSGAASYAQASSSRYNLSKGAFNQKDYGNR